MNCILCPATFETKAIDTGHSNPAKRAAAEAELAAQTAEGEKWEHVHLTTTRGGGRLELLAGSVCPAHDLQPGAVKLSVA